MGISLLRALSLLLLVGTASAQPMTVPVPPRQPSSLEQALAARIQQETNNNISCLVTTVDLRKELDAAQARIKELEAKK